MSIAERTPDKDLTVYGFMRAEQLYGQIFPSIAMAETYAQVRELEDDWRLVQLTIRIKDLDVEAKEQKEV